MIKFKIFNKKWRIMTVKRKKFAAKYGPDDIAVTVTHKKIIRIKKGHVNYETITHELLHAYLEELCTSSASLNRDDFEEIIAEMFGKYGHQMLKLSRELTKRLNK